MVGKGQQKSGKAFPPLPFRAMPERKHFFSQDGFPKKINRFFENNQFWDRLVENCLTPLSFAAVEERPDFCESFILASRSPSVETVQSPGVLSNG